MNPLKIVIVSGVIFPRIAPRAFRATELAKALAKKGHNVTLISSLGKYNYSEFQKETKVVVKDLGTPYFATKNSDGKIDLPLWKKGVVFSLMRLLEFPDILLMRKVKKAILNEGEIDLLITVALPYPIHWGASLIKDRNFNTWVSDCGDPYMGRTIQKPFFYFKHIEKWWSKKTDYISVPIEDARNAYYENFRKKIFVIPQGFNFNEIPKVEYKKNSVPTFIYTGLFYPELRDPTKFLQYLTSIKEDFRFIVYTSNSSLLKPFQEILKEKIEINNVIGREELLEKIKQADFLINIPNKNTSSQVPSKLIDYALSKRPILNISSDFTEKEKKNFEQFVEGNFTNQLIIGGIENYNIENVSEQFLDLYRLNNG